MKISQHTLIFFVALFFVLFDNVTFFHNVTQIYPLKENFLFIISLAVVLFALIAFLLTLVSFRFMLKPLVIVLLLVSSCTNYFMQTYNIVIDTTMIENTFQTNFEESFDLFSWTLVGYFLFFGLIPSYIVFVSKIRYTGFLSTIRMSLIYIVLIGLTLFSFSKYYTSFFRENKPLRFYTNPTYYVYSLGKYTANRLQDGQIQIQEVGLDAKQVAKQTKRVVVMVVGEAARSDRFSLGGYARQTNPYLEKEDIVYFSNLSSCGTTTAISVPCMFSLYSRNEYDYKKGISTHNALDILSHTNTISLLWRDNNSDSKGVATRIEYEDFRNPQNNTLCEGECRDEGMLLGLDTFIESQKEKDVFIVLHQMGNHGPAYYKRYPKEFEKFTPVCTSNQLEECTQKEISNAYDNAILYTDYFLFQTIEFLKHYPQYETAMLYMSDHGESLGENGLYLHGMPYFMAPQTQTHVAGLLWMNEKMKEQFDYQKLKDTANNDLSHDYLFHTILGLMGVQTKLYNPNLDILRQ